MANPATDEVLAPSLPGQPLSTEPSQSGRMLVLMAAFLGWMFDGLEMGIMPQIAGPALSDLIRHKVPNIAKPELDGLIKYWNVWIDAMFLFGAAFGGLAFGWLGDKIGRVKAMSASILVYSGFTGFLYFAQTPLQIALLRFVPAFAFQMQCIVRVWRR